jgi:hypothetical protein
MDLSKDFEIKIARFDHSYPVEAPDSYVVGFIVTHRISCKSMYQDTRVLYTDVVSGVTDMEVASIAWKRVEPAFEPWMKSVSENKTSVVGSVFDPSRVVSYL